MLRAKSKGWLSRNFDLIDGEIVIAVLMYSGYVERGEFTLADRTFSIHKQSLFSYSWFLQEGEKPVASAESPGFFSRSLEVTFDERTLLMVVPSLLSRTFVVREGDRELGSLRMIGLFSSEGTCDLPEDLPLELRAFIFWLAIFRWTRQAGST